MNELTLHYVNQSDRERTIEEDLRNRQLLDAATDVGPKAATTVTSATATSIRTEAAATGTAPTDKPVTATRLGKTPIPRPTAVRARAAGR
jgi:hypothetical protein